MVPKDAHVPVPGTFEYVTLGSKKEFLGTTKLRLLKWEDPQLSSGHTCNLLITSVLKESKEIYVTMKAEKREGEKEI